MGAIFKREMKAYFSSPIAYIFLAVFYLYSGVYFVLINLNPTGATTDLSYVFTQVFTIIMIILPLLTMRLMSDEKKLKTDQCLLTAPVSLSGIVMGKFLAAFVVYLCAMAIYIPYIIVLYSEAGYMIWSTVIGNIVGLALVGAAFISIGIFVSSLTELQIAAAIFGVIINFVLFMIDVFASYVSWAPLRTVMISIGFYSRYVEFTQGILNITSVIFFISAVFVFNFLTVRVLEKRRWS